MPQTLLGLCAVLIFSIFALGQHRSKADLEDTAMAREIENAAADFARKRLGEITRFAFDNADVGSLDIRQSTAGLTPIAGLGVDTIDGESFSPAVGLDDVDDFIGTRNQTFPLNWIDLRFTTTVEVDYVDPADTANTAVSPTLAKRVTITVTESDLPEGRPPVTVRLSKVVTPVWTRLHR